MTNNHKDAVALEALNTCQRVFKHSHYETEYWYDEVKVREAIALLSAIDQSTEQAHEVDPNHAALEEKFFGDSGEQDGVYDTSPPQSTEPLQEVFARISSMSADQFKAELSKFEGSELSLALQGTFPSQSTEPVEQEPIKLQDIMFEVFEYARFMDGIGDLIGSSRDEVRRCAMEQDGKIREMIECYASTTQTVSKQEPCAYMHTYRNLVGRNPRVYCVADIGEYGPDPKEGFQHVSKEPLIYASTQTVSQQEPAGTGEVVGYIAESPDKSRRVLTSMGHLPAWQASEGWTIEPLCRCIQQAKEQGRDDIVTTMDKMTEEERMEIFSNFCVHCGKNNPRCQCWNDE